MFSKDINIFAVPISDKHARLLFMLYNLSHNQQIALTSGLSI